MKFVTYKNGGVSKLGILLSGVIVDVQTLGKQNDVYLPDNLLHFLQDWNKNYDCLSTLIDSCDNDYLTTYGINTKEVKFEAPLVNPISVRDGYAFRQHVAAARRNRGVEMIPEFDEYPVFYFTNHTSTCGCGDLVLEEDHFNKLDFELEVAVVIGKSGKNIRAKDADDYIAGLMIMNDISARTLQMEEMKLNLGPAKGKDFASSFGPYFVTIDELEKHSINTEFGKKWNLKMKAFHNGIQISEGNVADMNWTFAELIERASYGVTLNPGEIIASGTVGTGCYLELNGTNNLLAKEAGKDFIPVWIKEGDSITLEIDELGSLYNTFSKNPNSYSLLSLKK